MVGRAVPINVTVYPEDLAVIDQVAKDYGGVTRSSAIRYIIRDWVRMQAREAGIVLEDDKEAGDGGAGAADSE